MRKITKILVSGLAVLSMVAGIAVTPASKVNAETKAKEFKSATKGYCVTYCEEHMVAKATETSDIFEFSKHDVEKEAPFYVAIRKAKSSYKEEANGLKLQAENDGKTVSVDDKVKLTEKQYSTILISYEVTDDPRGAYNMFFYVIDGAKSDYVIEVASPKVVDESYDSDDVELIVNSFTEKVPTMKEAYKAKIAELKKLSRFKKGVSSVQIKCGKGNKILVVTPGDKIFEDGATVYVEVYQYVNGKVNYICKLESIGTAYPIAFNKKALLAGGHHGSIKLEVNKGKATCTKITGANMSVGTGKMQVYSVSNGKMKLKSTKKISVSQATSMDFYTDAKGKCKGEVIGFE